MFSEVQSYFKLPIHFCCVSLQEKWEDLYYMFSSNIFIRLEKQDLWHLHCIVKSCYNNNDKVVMNVLLPKSSGVEYGRGSGACLVWPVSLYIRLLGNFTAMAISLWYLFIYLFIYLSNYNLYVRDVSSVKHMAQGPHASYTGHSWTTVTFLCHTFIRSFL